MLQARAAQAAEKQSELEGRAGRGEGEDRHSEAGGEEGRARVRRAAARVRGLRAKGKAGVVYCPGAGGQATELPGKLAELKASER